MNAVNKNLENKKMRSEILELRKTLLNLKFQKSTGQLEKTAEIRKQSRTCPYMCLNSITSSCYLN